MSKLTNRPMSEYESATFFAFTCLAEEWAKTADATNLLARIDELHKLFLFDGRTNGAAYLAELIEAIRRAKGEPTNV